MPDSLDSVGRSRKPGVRKVKSDTLINAGVPSDQAGDPDEIRFQDILEGVSGGPAEKRLENILSDIQRLAGLLAHRRLLEDLEDYRNKVGEFLRVYMDEVLSLREATGRLRGSRRKQLLVVKRVNIELEELSRLVIRDAPDFKILKEIGTIEGLLMDLYR